VLTEAVTTGCGSDDLLDSAFRAVSGPGGRVAHSVPTFSMVTIFARMNGLEAVGVEEERARDDPLSLLEARPDAVYLCSPNNPTGSVLPTGWLEELLRAGGPDGPVLLLDEAYADFARRTWVQGAPATDRLLVLRTLSKAYGLAGLRVGYGVGAPEVVAEVEKSRGPYKIGRIDEEAGVRALEDGGGWVDGIVARTRRNRERLAEALRIRGFDPLPSEANFLFLPVDDAPVLTARLRERGVAVRPFPRLTGIGDGVRVSVGPWPLLEAFLEALDEVLEGEGGREAEEEATP